MTYYPLNSSEPQFIFIRETGIEFLVLFWGRYFSIFLPHNPPLRNLISGYYWIKREMTVLHFPWNVTWTPSPPPSSAPSIPCNPGLTNSGITNKPFVPGQLNHKVRGTGKGGGVWTSLVPYLVLTAPASLCFFYCKIPRSLRNFFLIFQLPATLGIPFPDLPSPASRRLPAIDIIDITSQIFRTERVLIFIFYFDLFLSLFQYSCRWIGKEARSVIKHTDSFVLFSHDGV